MNNRYKRADLLRQSREKQGYSQRELAEILHYSNKTISKWETGISYPTDYNTLKKYADLLKLDISDIVLGKKTDNKEEIIIGYLKLRKQNINLLIRLLLSTILIFFFLFYIIYIKYEKGHTKEYELIIEDYELPRHTLFVSNKINILDFHKINDNNIEEILLYYKDNNEVVNVFNGENDNYLIKNDNTENEYNLKNIENKEIYLKIKINGTNIIKRINTIEIYNNNKITFYDNINTKKIINNSCNIFTTDNFIKVKNLCTKKYSDNIKIIYDYKINKIYMNIYNVNKLIIIEKSIKDTFFIVSEILINGNITINKVKKEKIMIYTSEISNYFRYINYLENKMFSS